MARAKCKYCNEEILTKEEKLIIFEKTKNGVEKGINLHKECQKDYDELMEYKANEMYWFNEVYEHLKALLGYTEEQRLPRSLITRIQDLRNGTILKRGEGRVVKSKEGYRYEIILDCLLTNGDNIRWAMKNNTFHKEINRINYLMAIIEGNINDIYNLFSSRERQKNDISNDMIREEMAVMELAKKETTIKTPKSNKGISKFLDEDDL